MGTIPESMTLAQLAARLGLSLDVVRNRLRACPELQALTVRAGRSHLLPLMHLDRAAELLAVQPHTLTTAAPMSPLRT